MLRIFFKKFGIQLINFFQLTLQNWSSRKDHQEKIEPFKSFWHQLSDCRQCDAQSLNPRFSFTEFTLLQLLVWSGKQFAVTGNDFEKLQWRKITFLVHFHVMTVNKIKHTGIQIHAEISGKIKDGIHISTLEL